MSDTNGPDYFKEASGQITLRNLVDQARDQYGIIEYERATDAIKLVQELVRQFVGKYSLDSKNLLFCGFNKELPKDPDGEHQGAIFMGDYLSLGLPSDLDAAPEIQGEHWVVNPILYALEGGSLAIYDRTGIESDRNLHIPEPIDVDFGTLIVNGDSEQIRRHQLGTIQIYE